MEHMTTPVACPRTYVNIDHGEGMLPQPPLSVQSVALYLASHLFHMASSAIQLRIKLFTYFRLVKMMIGSSC